MKTLNAMRTLSATRAKNPSGQLPDDAQVDPVIIQKNGRNFAVLVFYSEFQLKISANPVRDLVQKYHEESMDRYGDLYAELAK